MGDIREILLKKLLKRDDIIFDYSFKKLLPGTETPQGEVTEGQESGSGFGHDLPGDPKGLGGESSAGAVIRQEKFPSLPEYYLFEDTTSNGLMLLNQKEYDEFLDKNRLADLDSYKFITSNPDINEVIKEGRHKALFMPGGFDERYEPNSVTLNDPFAKATMTFGNISATFPGVPAVAPLPNFKTVD